MKCKLIGIQGVNFKDRETGEQITGAKLHVLSEVEENTAEFRGRRTAAPFVRFDTSNLKVGDQVDLVYDQVLGSNKSRLVEVKKA